MKTLTLLMSLLPALGGAAPAPNHHQAHEPSAVHGMLVLESEGKVYLSHLPMFHPLHDQQVIFSAKLDVATMAALKASKDASEETVYTLVPEPFQLKQMIAQPHSFTAQLFKGHFERGGELIADKVLVTKVAVGYHKQLKANAPQPDQISYFQFGKWLAHIIHGKPDFDQLLEVEGMSFEEIILFPGLDPSAPLEAGKELKAGDGSVWKIKKQVYLEFDDLAH